MRAGGLSGEGGFGGHCTGRSARQGWRWRILSIRADSQEKDKGIYHLRGHVEVTYHGMKLTADEEPPPGAGFVTTTGYEPAVARSAVDSEMVNWLALT